LPIYPNMTDTDVERVIHVVGDTVKALRR
jgi:dTDP-4-amino-4,6-dideoxygalactose transaminase